MINNLANFFVMEENSLRDVMKCIDLNTKNIALVVDDNNRLINTLTDGDIRRAILNGFSLDRKVKELIAHLKRDSEIKPVVADINSSNLYLLDLMEEHGVKQIPLVNPQGVVIDLVTLDDFIKENPNKIEAVIMAGGFGTRLKPLTDEIPKPMLPIGDQPILQIIIDNLKKSGIYNINISTHYQHEKIYKHFGDGNKQGININYVSEEEPLGTAGAIREMENSKNPILVINGDILTNMNFKDMFNFHKEHDSDLTVAVRKYDFQVPYGVLDSEGVRVKNIIEKPVYEFYVNAGIYLINSNLLGIIPKNKKYDMTEFISDTIKADKNVSSFPIVEYWLDIGRPEDYEKAQVDIVNKKLLT